MPIFEHRASKLSDIGVMLASLGVHTALVKTLSHNANDKNQLYIASNVDVLYGLFALNFGDRGTSSSLKPATSAGGRIREGVFERFSWVLSDGSLAKARRAKAIIYPQYPEVRISGFETQNRQIPATLSVAFTKENPEVKRLLVLGQRPGGECVALVYYPISPELEAEIGTLPGFEGSKVCRRLEIRVGGLEKLAAKLEAVVARDIPGCRLDRLRGRVPFSGTQVCGYTLEHELGIAANSLREPDYEGIELKAHTEKRVTLFTPEPDGGLYSDNFAACMERYGYEDSDGALRITGVHRAGVRYAKSGLTLRVQEWAMSDSAVQKLPYEPGTALTSKIDTIHVVLEDDDGATVASWSLTHLLPHWGAKHNEVLYVPAVKNRNPDDAQRAAGFEYVIRYGVEVLYCKGTSAERLVAAINSGMIYLDPAPKLNRLDPSKNKRRCQWRVADIAKAAPHLYGHVEVLRIQPQSGDQERIVLDPFAGRTGLLL